MPDLTAVQAAANATYLRDVMPVLADYVRHIVHGAELDRLKLAAQASKAAPQLQLIDALIAARAAVDSQPRPGEDAAKVTTHDLHVRSVVFTAITRVTTNAENAWLRLQVRDEMADAVLADLAAQGYAITYIGGGT